MSIEHKRVKARSTFSAPVPSAPSAVSRLITTRTMACQGLFAGEWSARRAERTTIKTRANRARRRPAGLRRRAPQRDQRLPPTRTAVHDRPSRESVTATRIPRIASGSSIVPINRSRPPARRCRRRAASKSIDGMKRLTPSPQPSRRASHPSRPHNSDAAQHDPSLDAGDLRCNRPDARIARGRTFECSRPRLAGPAAAADPCVASAVEHEGHTEEDTPVHRGAGGPR